MKTGCESGIEGTNAELLFEDKIKAAYHLALLDRPYSEHVVWWRHRAGDGRADATAAFYTLNHPTIIFLLGEADGLGKCLASAQLPDFTYVAYFPEHAGAVNEWYTVARPVEMRRMVLKRDAFRGRPREPAVAAPAYCGRPVVLRPTHLNLLPELYNCEPGYRLDTHQYEWGRYMGIVAGGKLLAAAGTHFVSEEHSFAIIGNVLTLPGLRRLGLATRTVAGLLDRLFEGVEAVCLNVRSSNAAAVKLYESLGFATHCTYCEGTSLLRRAATSARQEAV